MSRVSSSWELSAGLTQISVTVKGGAVELGGHVDSFLGKMRSRARRLARGSRQSCHQRDSRCRSLQSAAERRRYRTRGDEHARVELPGAGDGRGSGGRGVGDPFRQRRTATAEGRGRARAMHDERDHGHPAMTSSFNPPVILAEVKAPHRSSPETQRPRRQQPYQGARDPWSGEPTRDRPFAR